MKPECSRIVSVILPAIRASVAEDLYRKYNLRQAALEMFLSFAIEST